ncbi:SDR family oxidoreductase [Pseudoroseomonas globiformis]|uniref:SDR family oxidoreductase n=1 Tax=Teichococcus globiformis TaxID=2307229 RepID=A0ABV7FYK0_9PROT
MVAEMEVVDIDALLNVHLRAAVLLARAAIPHLAPGGRMVFIGSSLADRTVSTGVTVYAAAKSARIALTRGLARELGLRNITVNLVQPGATDTEMNPADGALAKALRDMTPRARYGKPKTWRRLWPSWRHLPRGRSPGQLSQWTVA